MGQIPLKTKIYTLCEGQTFLIFSGICPILNLQGCKPNETLPPLVFDLLKHILTDYNRRYTIDDIMKHEMFKDTNWNSVYDDFEIESKVKNILINEELIKVSSPQIKEQRTAFWSNS